MKLDKESIISFIKLNQRVLQVAKRPDREEYYNVARITGSRSNSYRSYRLHNKYNSSTCRQNLI